MGPDRFVSLGRPPMVKDRLADDLRFVKRLASEAAQVALARAQQVVPQEKANLSYVTDLDRELELMIRARLREAFPGDLLTGEEYAAEPGAEAAGAGGAQRRW